MALVIFYKAKAVAEHSKNIAVSAGAPDEIETSIGFKGLEKDPEGLVERRLITKIVEPGLLKGLVENGLLVETEQGEAVHGQMSANRSDKS